MGLTGRNYLGQELELVTNGAVIIIGEFGIALVFALLALTLRRDSWRLAVVAGVAGGAPIFVCYALAFLITDRLIK